MSSASSYASSPPSSPNQITKYQRLSSETNLDPTGNADQLSDTHTNTNLVTNNLQRLSSNESLNQSSSQDDCTTSAFKTISLSEKSQHNNELETTYMTNMSKNSITLRKTESLKLDNVPSIRNRFDRMNSSNLSTLTRRNNKNHHLTQQHSLNETLDGNHSSSNNHNSISLIETGEQPPPPTLILSPLSPYGLNKPAATQPLLMTATNGINCVKKRVWTPVQNNNNSNFKSCDTIINGMPSNVAEVKYTLMFFFF
jgi:hypothetical protein